MKVHVTYKFRGQPYKKEIIADNSKDAIQKLYAQLGSKYISDVETKIKTR